MAVRPVYVVRESAPYFSVTNVEFGWNGGFAKVQKQKNIRAIHAGFMRSAPGKKCTGCMCLPGRKGISAWRAIYRFINSDSPKCKKR